MTSPLSPVQATASHTTKLAQALLETKSTQGFICRPCTSLSGVRVAETSLTGSTSKSPAMHSTKVGVVTSATISPQAPIPQQKYTSKNQKYPASRGRLVNSRAPLECFECKRGFHLKWTPQTRPALEHLRSTHSWTCQACLSAHNSRTAQQSDGKPHKPRNSLRNLTRIATTRQRRSPNSEWSSRSMQ